MQLKINVIVDNTWRWEARSRLSGLYEIGYCYVLCHLASVSNNNNENDLLLLKPMTSLYSNTIRRKGNIHHLHFFVLTL